MSTFSGLLRKNQRLKTTTTTTNNLYLNTYYFIPKFRSGDIIYEDQEQEGKEKRKFKKKKLNA